MSFSWTAFAIPAYVDSLFYARYAYVRLLEADDEVPVLTDEDFFNTSASIVFPVSRYDLPDVAASPLLSELENEIIPHFNSDTLRLVRLEVRGAASPEGPTAFNQQLGARRTESLLRFFSERMTVSEKGLLASQSIVEDYGTLCMLMRRANDPDYALVQGLCYRYLDSQPETLKRELQAAKGGALWLRLQRTYFPQLRSARFVLFLQKVPKPLRPDTMPAATVVADFAADTISAPITVLDILRTDSADFQPLTLPRREFLAVKTNLLLYGFYLPDGYNRWAPIPNVAIEYFPQHGHFTFGFSFDCPWWQDYDAHKYFQIRNYQFEARYYVRSGDIDRRPLGEGAAFRGFYLSAYAHTFRFGICMDADRGWVGEGGGAGLGLGYVLPISRRGHWRLEFSAQAGFLRCRYDPYQYENPINSSYHDNLYYYKWTGKPADFRERQYRFNWLGPTRVGITLSYDILYRRNQKNGISFRPNEKVESNGANGAHGTYGTIKNK